MPIGKCPECDVVICKHQTAASDSPHSQWTAMNNWRDPLRVACTACGALANKRCREVFGRRKPKTQQHWRTGGATMVCEARAAAALRLTKLLAEHLAKQTMIGGFYSGFLPSNARVFTYACWACDAAEGSPCSGLVQTLPGDADPLWLCHGVRVDIADMD